MGSHGIKDRVAIVGMGCTRFAEHWDKGLDDLLLDATGEAFASAGVTKEEVDAYWLGTAQGGMSGMLLAKPLQLEGKPVDARREHVRHRLRGVAPGRLRRGLRRLRPGDGGRGREGEGLGLPGPQRLPRAQRRHAAHAHRRRHVLDGRPGLRRALRRSHGRAQGRARPDRVEEPLQRRSQPARAVPAGDVGGADPRHARRRRLPLGVRLCRRGRWSGRGHRLPGRGRPPLHGLAALREGAVVRGRQRVRPHRCVVRLHDVPRDRGLCPGCVRAGGHHRSEDRAGHGRGARLLHPDRAGADGGPRLLRSAARPGRRSSPAPST